MKQIPIIRQPMQEKFRKMGLKSLNPWWILNAILAHNMTFYGQAKNHVGQVKIIKYLPDMVS